jgi:hypothetical protein
MSELAQVVSRTNGTRINLSWPNADVVFGGIMALLALIAMATYNLDLSWGFF